MVANLITATLNMLKVFRCMTMGRCVCCDLHLTH